MIRIDYFELEAAMDAAPEHVSGIRSYLDRRTGAVLVVSQHDDYDDSDMSEAIEADPERYQEIPTFDSRESYHELVEFAEGVDEDDIRDQLEVALAGRRGVFGRFFAVVGKYPDLRARWDGAQREHRIARMRRWLDEEGIEAELTLPHPPSGPEPAAPQLQQNRPRLVDLLLLGAPDGKTERIDGRVRRVLHTRTGQDGRAAFKRLAREACEMSGVPWRRRLIQGTSVLEVGRLRLEQDGATVWLSVEVPAEVWAAFFG